MAQLIPKGNAHELQVGNWTLSTIYLPDIEGGKIVAIFVPPENLTEQEEADRAIGKPMFRLHNIVYLQLKSCCVYCMV